METIETVVSSGETPTITREIVALEAAADAKRAELLDLTETVESLVAAALARKEAWLRLNLRKLRRAGKWGLAPKEGEETPRYLVAAQASIFRDRHSRRREVRVRAAGEGYEVLQQRTGVAGSPCCVMDIETFGGEAQFARILERFYSGAEVAHDLVADLYRLFEAVELTRW